MARRYNGIIANGILFVTANLQVGKPNAHLGRNEKEIERDELKPTKATNYRTKTGGLAS